MLKIERGARRLQICPMGCGTCGSEYAACPQCGSSLREPAPLPDPPEPPKLEVEEP